MVSTMAGLAAATPFHMQATALMSSARGRAVVLPIGGRRRLLFPLSAQIDRERRCTVFQPRNSRLHQCRLPRVTNGDAEWDLSIEKYIMEEQTLLSNLEAAIKDEDYALAATIKDQLLAFYEDSKFGIISANARFYSAFKNHDLAAMRSIWSKGDHVYDFHPTRGRISGYDMIIKNWKLLIDIDLMANYKLHVRGSIGYISCLEIKKTNNMWSRQLATNVFEKINGQWHICVHHISDDDCYEVGGDEYNALYDALEE